MQYSPNNTALIKKLKTGDQAVYKELYLRYYPKLIGIGKKFDFGLLSPEDFVHETFLRLYKNREQLKEHVLLDKQLFVICKNIILNHIKKEKRNMTTDSFDLFLEADENAPDQRTEIARGAILERLLERLPKKQEQIFRLHKIDGHSYKEIEALTGLSPKTIANHLYLATKFLKENVQKETSQSDR
ncbi:RNA polymerase sigma-70 factor, ECF subfamily [Parapedobacter composti]|uniref:RNA polymerase sigma-70 factor, ECF subfamily n=2 Tax=Parapedobacter composti TaxID=623281 RepID=A0A1I1LZD9_9SPHI|nr:RNA polymerase sigma-70 factor, ECF subfamily [Parapedobacter composti]